MNKEEWMWMQASVTLVVAAAAALRSAAAEIVPEREVSAWQQLLAEE